MDYELGTNYQLKNEQVPVVLLENRPPVVCLESQHDIE